MDLKPTKCNLCGGKVIFTSNRIIYGREYGSGKCYFCTNCKGYVGTHEPRPTEALGLISDKEMREMKMKCHALFDQKWKNAENKHKARSNAYKDLAKKLKIPVNMCHFGYFDLDMLYKAYRILEE